MENDALKSITDAGLIVALITVGFEVLSTERDATGRMHFNFSNDRSLNNAIVNYWSGGLKVSARQFHENNKMFKSRIYGG